MKRSVIPFLASAVLFQPSLLYAARIPERLVHQQHTGASLDYTAAAESGRSLKEYDGSVGHQLPEIDDEESLHPNGRQLAFHIFGAHTPALTLGNHDDDLHHHDEEDEHEEEHEEEEHEEHEDEHEEEHEGEEEEHEEHEEEHGEEEHGEEEHGEEEHHEEEHGEEEHEGEHSSGDAAADGAEEADEATAPTADVHTIDDNRPITRTKSRPGGRGFSKSGRKLIEHGKWVRKEKFSPDWLFIAKTECEDNKCAGTVADDNLRSVMDLPLGAKDEELLQSITSTRKWSKRSDAGLREYACRGHKHTQEFWCRGQAGLSGQMAFELDAIEAEWRQKAIDRQRAKFEMLEFEKKRGVHEDEFQRQLDEVAAEKAELARKKAALKKEEEEVRALEKQAKEELAIRQEAQNRVEAHLREVENAEVAAWSAMQQKRQLVLKFRALNKDQVADLVHQQRQEEKRERNAREYARAQRGSRN